MCTDVQRVTCTHSKHTEPAIKIRKHTFAPASAIRTMRFHANNLNAKTCRAGPTEPTEVGNLSAVRPPAHPRCFAHADLCKRRGQWSGKRHASGHTRGGLTKHTQRGGLSHLRVEPNVLPFCPRTAPARAVAHHSARRASSPGQRAQKRARARDGASRSSKSITRANDRGGVLSHLMHVDL